MVSSLFPTDTGGVCFIAEAGVNHNGDVNQALALVDAAANSGADAVKFQTFSADRLVAMDADAAEYQQERTDADSMYDLLQQYEFSADEFERIQRRCAEMNIAFLSTPFDPESASLLDKMDVPAIKLGSGELTNHPLLRHVADIGRPMIVSTGMATLEEVHEAYDCIRERNPTVPLALMHCTSSYPSPMADVNLRAMETLDREFPVPVGYSDHTTAVETPAFATAAGALVVEKHFTLDRTLPGPDHEASLEPDELDRAVALARSAATARGRSSKAPVESELEVRTVARKSLHAARALEAGTTLTADDVAIKRPNDGLPPMTLDDIVGATVRHQLEPDEPLAEEDLDR